MVVDPDETGDGCVVRGSAEPCHLRESLQAAADQTHRYRGALLIAERRTDS
jgi:hypothetical protein